MNEIVGIDLGTTNSLIGIMDSGLPLLLPDENGQRLTPSVVYLGNPSHPLVGAAALRMRSVDPAATIYSIKRFIGLRGRDVTAADLDLDYQIAGQGDELLRVRVDPVEYLPEKISAIVLRRLKESAGRAVGYEVTRAVITVPAYFNDAQRNATKRAGELAGFEVMRVLNEPTAAALAYGIEESGERRLIAVYDFGGGTFDLSILELNHGVFEVLATNGNTRLGGDDIDAAILSAERFHGVVSNREAKARLREAVVAAKHRLSTEQETPIDVPFLENNRNFSTVLTRSELDGAARRVIERTRQHCRRALADAKIDARDLDQVILVGGVTRMPLVRDFVAEIFGCEPNISQNPDEAVAIGATIQAGVLSGAVSNVVLLDVTPLSLGIETFGGLMNVIIPRNSTIPTRAGEMFTTAVDDQRAMAIKVLQGEREMARDNWTLGQFEITFEPAPKGIPRVGVQFEIDSNGILHVLVRDTKTGQDTKVELKSAVEVDDQAVEAMLAGSLEHAFEDVNERAWVELKVKGEEMLVAVGKGLAMAGADLNPVDHSTIIRSADLVRAALGTGNRADLKKAIDALDAETQGLAAMLVERAIAPNSTIPEIKE